MRHLLLATTVLILAGCSDDDPGTQLAACKVEAIRLWPNEDASGALCNEPDTGCYGSMMRNHIDEYVYDCMRAHGYHQNVQPDNCIAKLRFYMQSACYETSTQYWFEKQLNRFKNALAEHSNAR